MRTLTVLATLVLFAACGGEDAPPADAADESMAAETMESTASMADYAGTWELMAMIDGAEEPVAVTMEGTADGTWMMMLPDREPLSVTAEMVGDSLIMNVAEYESVLRAGVMVSTRTAVVMEGEMMMGKIEATYAGAEGAEVVGGTLEGSRAGM